eukprot:3260069-Rhodomonas_salina.3
MLVVFRQDSKPQINLASLAQPPAVLALTPLAVSPETDTMIQDPINMPSASDSSSSSSSLNLSDAHCKHLLRCWSSRCCNRFS